MSKLKIATVFMPWYRMESPPPDFALLNSVLKKYGFETTIFDLNKDMFNRKIKERPFWKYLLLQPKDKDIVEFWNRNYVFFEEYANKILKDKPDVVIFKIATNNFGLSDKMSRLIKKIAPTTWIIFSNLKFHHQDLLRKLVDEQIYYKFDFLIHGEDELVLDDLLKAIVNKNWEDFDKIYWREDKVIDTYNGNKILFNLDELPFYDYSNYNLKDFKYQDRLEIYTSRGCLFNCTFCTDWLVEKNYRTMSGKRIFEEFKYQKLKHPELRHIRLTDKLINGDLNVMYSFSKEMIKNQENLGYIGWSGDAVINKNMDLSLLKLMRKAGCEGLCFGLESASDKVLQLMRKPFNISTAEKVIKNTKKADIFTTVNILIGFPGENEEDFNETLKFIERNKKYIDEIRLTYSSLKIYKYSYLYFHPEEFNLKVDDPYSWYENDDWETIDGLNTYKVRLDRAKRLIQKCLDMGIKVMYNSRRIMTFKKIN